MTYIGRFAPSPTGPLHMGSLITAVASYCQARVKNGQWLLRIEDIDPPREVPGATTDIINSLEQLGFEWDGEIIYQSNRIDFYQHALEKLQQSELIYACGCSRSELAASATSSRYGIRYAGTCRHGLSKGKMARSLRVIVPDKSSHFMDAIQGEHEQNLQRDIGDFVVKRADGQMAYQLAVVVDDAEQKVTEVVRGSDLLDSTARQIYLQQCLGVPSPTYAHIPVLVNAAGEKLSKQTGARPVEIKSAGAALVHALCYLNQQPPPSLQNASVNEIWSWTIEHWRLGHVHRQLHIPEQHRHSK